MSGEDEHLCARCDSRYRDSENRADACRYHPGGVLDFDRVGVPGFGSDDFWECCHETMARSDVSHGCARGWHVEAAPGAPSRLERLQEVWQEHEDRFRVAVERVFRAKERLLRACSLVEEFLDGRRPDGLAELDDEHVAALLDPQGGRLVGYVRDTIYPAERRRALALLVKAPDIQAELLRLVERLGDCDPAE